MKRHMIIANPAAGNGVAARRIPLLRRLLDEQDISYDLAVTERPMHAAEIARDAEAAGYEVVVAAGGDGTCNEVVNGLYGRTERSGPSREAKATFAVLCIGRGNDFAFANGIPHDLKDGVRLLANPQTRFIDVGRIKGDGTEEWRYFCNGVGIGFDAIVAAKAARMRRLGGFLGYAVGAIGTIIELPDAPRVRIDFDGSSVEQESPQISIMNGRRMGGAFYMAPDALPDDGLLDLWVARRVRRRTMIQLFGDFLHGTQGSSPALAFHRGTSFEIRALEGSLYAHIDGEIIASQADHLTVECRHESLQVVCGNIGARGAGPPSAESDERL